MFVIQLFGIYVFEFVLELVIKGEIVTSSFCYLHIVVVLI